MTRLSLNAACGKEQHPAGRCTLLTPPLPSTGSTSSYLTFKCADLGKLFVCVRVCFLFHLHRGIIEKFITCWATCILTVWRTNWFICCGSYNTFECLGAECVKNEKLTVSGYSKQTLMISEGKNMRGKVMEVSGLHWWHTHTHTQLKANTNDIQFLDHLLCRSWRQWDDRPGYCLPVCCEWNA